MAYSLATAAKMAGVTKPTIWRAIKSGKLSATRLEDNSFRIDPSELERYLSAFKETPPPAAEKQDATPSSLSEMNVKGLQEAIADRFEVRIGQLEELLRIERERISELRDDREHWREQAQRLALTHEKAAIVVPPAPSAPEAKPGLVARLAAALRS